MFDKEKNTTLSKDEYGEDMLSSEKSLKWTERFYLYYDCYDDKYQNVAMYWEGYPIQMCKDLANRHCRKLCQKEDSKYYGFEPVYDYSSDDDIFVEEYKWEAESNTFSFVVRVTFKPKGL